MTAPDGTSELLTTAWQALGGDAALLDLVEVRGGDPGGLLPSIWPALPAMVAAVACSTLAASVLDGARTGRPALPVSLDVEHVALAARSERYATSGTDDAPDLFAPLSRAYQTRDGWLRLHGNYAWHRERALRVLGFGDDVAATPQAVAAAIRDWGTIALEDTLAQEGALGFAMRSRAEWLDHPHGRAVADLPLLERSIGAAPGHPAGPGRVATGLKVLDMTRVIAGPVATRTLGAWGAHVLRLDSPRLPELPAQATDMLSGKSSAILDLADPPHRAHLESLLATADVMVQGYRPTALQRHGLDGASLAQRHPHLCVVTLSAWGRKGPWATRRGFDSLVQFPTGIAAGAGVDGQPGALPAQVLDHGTGYLAAAAAMLALAGTVRGQPPGYATLSLAQTAHWLMSGVNSHIAVPSERTIDAASRLVGLTGGRMPVHVLEPPGLVGDLRPRWSKTTDYGSDPAQWPFA